jgi:NAD(P)-dependent dehydrogenase (short-subunit alcohol dehydrogenase family)
MDIRDGVAVVTGGASGLGLATTRVLLGAGARVVIADLPGSPGAEVAAELGGDVRFAPVDVRDSEQVAAALDVADSLGALRVAVNCAGTGNAVRMLGRNGVFPLPEFTKIVEINLIGTFNVIRLAAERMAKQELLGEERGVVVNTASVAAFDGQIGQAAYAASKAGLIGLTKAMAKELAPRNIRVCAVSPGFIETDMTTHIPEEARKMMLQVTPLARLGRAEEVAAATVFLASSDASYITGEVLKVNGGMYM